MIIVLVVKHFLERTFKSSIVAIRLSHFFFRLDNSWERIGHIGFLLFFGNKNQCKEKRNDDFNLHLNML